jgi:diacylglycerol kinase family enzyme
VLKEKSFHQMIDFWYKALKTETVEGTSVDYSRITSIEVAASGDTQVLVQVDGEVFGELPMRFSVEPRALKVRVGASR